MNTENKTALIDFRASNITSFEEELHLSFSATRLAEKSVVRSISTRSKNPRSVLPALAILGANASGKSNVLTAMAEMRWLVDHSFRTLRPQAMIPRKSFRGASPNKPSSFEIEAIIEGIWYRYGYEVDHRSVLKEWAFFAPKGREVPLFEREGQEMSFGAQNLGEWKTPKEHLRQNALFVSTGAQYEDPNVTPLYNWFRTNLLIVEDDTTDRRQQFTSRLYLDPKSHEAIKELLQAADLGLSDLRVTARDAEAIDRKKKIYQAAGLTLTDEDLETNDINFVHRVGEGQVVFRPFQESKGTIAWLSLIGPIYDALQSGSVLLIDELGDSLHPALVQQIIGLFQRPETNPNFGQLVFTSHSISVLDQARGVRVLGRDQVYFTEKGYTGGSTIFRLSDLAPRLDDSISKRYLEGGYGATPMLDFQRFVAALEASAKK